MNALSASLTLSPELLSSSFRPSLTSVQSPPAPSFPSIATFHPFHRATTVRMWKPPSCSHSPISANSIPLQLLSHLKPV
ncbi:hypothetical protein S245_019274 [Arachis hypogaea]